MTRLSAVFHPVQQEGAPLRRKIILEIRQAIETGDLKSGDRLVEKDLCNDLGVSRTSIREALRELEAEGLLTSFPARGLIVSHISPQEAENIYRVRGALEALVAEQFARNPAPAALEKFERAVEELRIAYRAEDLAHILRAKKDLYNELCAGAGNFTVLEILSRLNSRISQLRGTSLSKPERLKSSMQEIETMLAAIKASNPKAARAAALLHVANAARAAIPDEKLTKRKTVRKSQS